MFVDIEKDTYNIDPAKSKRRSRKRRKPSCRFNCGQCADMDKIMAIAAAHRLPVAEDAAQALSSRHGEKMAEHSYVGLLQLLPDEEPRLPRRRRPGYDPNSDESFLRNRVLIQGACAKPKYYHQRPLQQQAGHHSRRRAVGEAARI